MCIRDSPISVHTYMAREYMSNVYSSKSFPVTYHNTLSKRNNLKFISLSLFLPQWVHLLQTNKFYKILFPSNLNITWNISTFILDVWYLISFVLIRLQQNGCKKTFNLALTILYWLLIFLSLCNYYVFLRVRNHTYFQTL